MAQSALPENFIRVTLDLFGEKGQEWLDQLPSFLAELEDRWRMRLLPPFNLSYNYVAPGVLEDGSEVVLKTWLVNVEMLSEMESLRHWNGRGIARLVAHDPEIGAMILERLRPGLTLAEIKDDDQATRVAAGVMQQLWIPAPHDPQQVLRTARGWAQGMGKLRAEFGGGVGPFPKHLVQAAESLFDELFASSGPMCLLHGDLHHWNILSAKRQPWLAIDPKGLVGEAEYEPGALLRNRWPDNADQVELIRFTGRRVDILCEVLGFDRQRVLRWAMAQAVLSAWWSYEDHHRVEHEMILFADALLKML